jgi:thioredoxin reductase (NADPH)
MTNPARNDSLRADGGVPQAIFDNDDPALYPKLAGEQLDLLARHGHEQPIQVGEVLFREGDATYDFMVLLAGRVAIVVGSGAAQRELVTHRPGDVIAELNILTGERMHATGLVREAGSVLVVPREEFRALLGRELSFGDFILQTLFRRRQAIARLRLGIQIVGSRFDADTHRLREFAARNRVLHDWLEVDEPGGQRLLRELRLDSPAGPIVLLGNGAFLRNPTNAELADAIGVAHHRPLPAEKTYDLVVIGAGPAGLAASVYGASSGLLTATLDAVAVGGQAATSARIENYLGFPAGLSGAELAERARIQAEKFNAHIMVPRRAVRLTEAGGFHVVALDDGDSLLARSVILALGVQYRRLPVPRITDYEGLGVTHAADAAWEQLRPGDAAVVVGGANSAGQAALSVAEDGRRVYLVVRAENFQRSMAGYLRDRIARHPSVEVLFGHEVRELRGTGHLEQVTVEDVQTGDQRVLDAGAVIVLIGAEARTQWLAGEIALDEDGYVLTGPALPRGLRNGPPWDTLGRSPFLLETSRPGVFAVGDVRSGSTKMVAPAVGEGGMAVRFAAEHLARVPRSGCGRLRER